VFPILTILNHSSIETYRDPSKEISRALLSRALRYRAYNALLWAE